MEYLLSHVYFVHHVIGELEVSVSPDRVKIRVNG